jgi:hypothetical protein
MDDASIDSHGWEEVRRRIEHLEGESRRWEAMRRRVEHLEMENYELKRRGLLAFGVLAVLVLGLIWWLAWPGKTLVAHWVRADVLQPSRVANFRGGVALDLRDEHGDQADHLALWDNPDSDSSIQVGFIYPTGYLPPPRGSHSPGIPRLSLSMPTDGAVLATVWGGPELALYADSDMMGRPQIELSLYGSDGSPQIVLRDKSGQEIWRAP